MNSFIVTEKEGLRKYAPCTIFSSDLLSAISSKHGHAILILLGKNALYVHDIARRLNIPLQTVYYHIQRLKPFLKVVDTRKVRGVIAHKYTLQSGVLSFLVAPQFSKHSLFYSQKSKTSASIFFEPFIHEGVFNAKIVVGSPDPHGPFKARARDGHYAVDLALYLGTFSRLHDSFSVALDVDVVLAELDANIIVVGGPVTNLIMNALSHALPVSFIEERQWALKGKKQIYNDDSVGLICRISHPFFPDKYIICLAGIRFSGTKAAVIGLTRMTKLVLSSFTNQKSFYAIINGFDLDGDGKIDSVELLESS